MSDQLWGRGWRERVFSDLDREWDLVVIGGGITGAGVLAEAAKRGLSALLVEANDFASGTSSRSSKLVHGGLRYLRHAQLKLTLESVRERERLLREGGGLVSPLDFYLTSFKNDRMPPFVLGFALAMYDAFAGKWAHQKHRPSEVVSAVPELTGSPLISAYHYYDAQTDDARLVLRVLREAVRRGGTALNYAPATELLRDSKGRARGVVITDAASENGTAKTYEVKARAVVSATGAWADEMRSKVGAQKKLRAIRGSHLVFPGARLPLTHAVSFFHPKDQRAVLAIPWEGVTLVGTTDVDHRADLGAEPSISLEEAEYILDAAHHAFPSLGLQLGDVISTYAGVRGVVDTGADPAKESREHVLWMEDGLLTVTGGKLTTFRLMAHEALRKLKSALPKGAKYDGPVRILDETRDVLGASSIADRWKARLVGRHGEDAANVVQCAENAGVTDTIDDTPALWAELRWAARAEAVVHLGDLLLRRARVGLLAPDGGARVMPKIRAVAQPELGWDDARWEREEAAYLRTWSRCYGVENFGSGSER